MTSKKLLISWFFLAVVAALGTVTHGVMMKEVPEIAAKEAPKYLPLTDLEAIKEALASCNKDVYQLADLAMAGGTCGSAYANPSARLVELSQESHKTRFYWKEIRPRVENLENGLNTNFTRLIVIVLLVAMVVFIIWCKSTLFSFVVQGRIKLRGLSFLDLKSKGPNRRVRQAESEFITIKNLHDNGLISDEMFLKRKEELQAALIRNEVFEHKPKP
ncbi:hypothetical protein [Janthinobacterium lividum]|nr:hypothetical protein [Janthinobacterium lividum]